jgi:hypothetical protein
MAANELVVRGVVALKATRATNDETLLILAQVAAVGTHENELQDDG